jgi:CRP/FNR family cyclic AMP-dependent transcriptional regulator
MVRKPATTDALNDGVLRSIAARGGVRSFPAHAVLVTEDDRSDALYIILEGRTKVYGSGDDGREVVYGTLGAGEYFGELTLDGGPRSASVMTLEPTACAVVPGQDVRDFLATYPDFAVHLAKKLIGLSRALTGQVKSLALDDVYGRIARLLRTLALDADGVPTLPEKLTQQDIADRVGASREMVSRIFKSLQEGGYVELRGGRIAILKRLPPRW